MATHLAQRLEPAHRREQPFPHYVVPDALPPESFARLVAEFPDDELVRRGLPAGDNRRFSFSAPEALAEPRLSLAWREAVLAHVGQDFLDGVLRALAGDIRATYPDLEARIGRPLEQWRAGGRRRDSVDTSEVAIAMPALGPSFGVAPSGTCTWMSVVLNTVGLMPRSTERERTSELAAYRRLNNILGFGSEIRVSVDHLELDALVAAISS